MGIRKLVQVLLHAEQLKWLETNAFADGKTLLRPKVAWESMKGFFHNTMRTDTMTPMWLEQGKIDDWLSKQVKSAKETMKQARASEKKAEKEVKSTAAAAPGGKKRPRKPSAAATTAPGDKQSKKAKSQQGSTKKAARPTEETESEADESSGRSSAMSNSDESEEEE